MQELHRIMSLLRSFKVYLASLNEGKMLILQVR